MFPKPYEQARVRSEGTVDDTSDVKLTGDDNEQARVRSEGAVDDTSDVKFTADGYGCEDDSVQFVEKKCQRKTTADMFDSETNVGKSVCDNAAVRLNEFIGPSHVFVDKNPLISTTTISTFGLSTCYFYLMCGTLNNCRFSYLNHNVDPYEKVTIADTLYFILHDIVVAFFVGGGAVLTSDIVRSACSLLLNADQQTCTVLKREFGSRSINTLFDKLFNRVTILKATSFMLSNEEESVASDMAISEQTKVVDPPSYTIFYNCLYDAGYITIDFGREKLFNIASMMFSLRSPSNNNFAWIIDYEGIKNIKDSIGPFLRTIFSKLENMLQNSLYVNLLLTGILARLAHYSQPLLRSLLLNHSLVLETNVKSLFQILSNLKSKLETISQTFNDFNNLIELAHDKERSSKRSRILDFFRGRGRPVIPADKNSNDNQQFHISFINQTSLKFINIRDNIVTQPINEWDDPKTRNIAYCAVIYNEFLKELAAITLEHSVQQFDDDQIFDDILPISLML
ncbi:unnamed protein product [Rotaria socialis]